MNKVKGYKVFNPDWTCRGFQYEVGKTYKHSGEIRICKEGFHFCEKASNCFDYYEFDSNNKVAEVIALDSIQSLGNKSVTNKIKIIREVSWQELLTIVNSGNYNTGYCNSGNYNTGNNNSGDYNTGNRNAGNNNSGYYNTGKFNLGNKNTGYCNTGYCNSGYYNTGNRNSGDYNTGDYNTGYYNTGHKNTGEFNSGNKNTGNCNAGNYNTGDWNIGNYNSGMFSTITPKISLFEKETELTHDEIRKIKGIQILNNNYKNIFWISFENMTESEKTNHPKHKDTGGYLKTLPFKEACSLMWNKLNNKEKEEVKNIPNFNEEIFLKITGIDINK